MFLGINGFSHDASAVIVDSEGRILAAVEEERFTGKKKEDRFPVESIRYCLNAAGISASDLLGIGFGWHPYLLLRDRVLRSNVFEYPVPLKLIRKNVRKAFLGWSIRRRFEREIGPLGKDARVCYFKHHTAHAASAFYASPFEEAAFLTLDGRGERESMTWGYGQGAQLYQLGANQHPNSLGNFYSGIARFLGFHSWEKDGTVMALAGCGQPKYMKEFRELLTLAPNGLSIKLNLDYFDCTIGDGLPRSSNLERLLGIKMRSEGEPIQQEHRDIAATLQAITQDIIIRICTELRELTGMDNLVIAGGVALNSVTNGMLRERTPFKDIFIPPAAHDGGLSLGCAYLLAHKGKERKTPHHLTNADLGPEFGEEEIRKSLDGHAELAWDKHEDIAGVVAQALVDGKKVAWFQGRLEYGPRALGNRSILADARRPNVQNELNSIKHRESFQPFAISVLRDEAGNWLCKGTESPFMLLVDRVKSHLRSAVPGAQHVDGSVRVQTVSEKENPLYFQLIREFFKITGVPLIINTSLNLRGAPLVCNPQDALQAFKNTNLDALAIGQFLVTKKI